MAQATEVTDATFTQEVVNAPGLTVVDFWAPWCGPCRMVAPLLDKLAGQYDGKARVVKVNVDDNQQVSMQYNIRSIPAILYFKDGKVVDQVIGAMGKQIEEKFAQHAA
jgi:thioredoxin 1